MWLTFGLGGLLQSDTASVAVAELDLELPAGTLGGLVTTVEGLMTNISQSEYLQKWGHSRSLIIAVLSHG
jgi:C4-type Zn-finger protein